MNNKLISLDYLKSINACEEAQLYFITESKGLSDIQWLNKLLKDNKTDWANWFVCRQLSNNNKIKYAIFAAEQVIGIYEKQYPDDKRPRKAIDAAKAYVKDPTKEHRTAAARAARAAAYAANAAAYAAANAADAANAAARAAANAAAYAAADAAYEAYTANAARKTKIIKYGIKLLKDEA